MERPVVVVASIEPEAVPAKVETVEEVQAEIRRVFGGRSSQALCIARHESGFNAAAKSPLNKDRYRSHDRGVFQINSYWHAEVSDQEAYDAIANIQHAYRISKGGTDWHQWSTRKFCGV